MHKSIQSNKASDQNIAKNPRSNRRSFLKRGVGGAVFLLSAPYIQCGESSGSNMSLQESVARLSAGSSGDEQFWRSVKSQYPIKDNFIIINAGNMTPSPISVMERQFQFVRSINEDTSHENRGTVEIYREKAREALAAFLGADHDEIAVTRNTSESNNVIITGLTLGRGDEVVIWEQNHPTNNVAWDVRSDRHGFTVKRVTTPPNPQSPEELIKPFTDALSRRTRVLAITDISSDTGIRVPAKELCALAQQNNVLSLVDGAQSAGCVATNLHDMECDFYTSSSQKWLTGPREAGLLYVKKEQISSLWPSVVGLGWEDAAEGGTARKFETYGHKDDAKFAAFETAVNMLATIDIERIEKRVYALAGSLRNELKKRVPEIVFYAPDMESVNAPIVKFRLPGDQVAGIRKRMYEEHNVGCAVHGGGRPGLRLCPHIYNTMEEMERTADAVATLFAT